MQVLGKTRKHLVAIVPCAPVAIVVSIVVALFLNVPLAAMELPVRYDAISADVRGRSNDSGYSRVFMDKH